MDKVRIETRCPFCGQTHEVEVYESDYMGWELLDVPAQRAFPYLSADDREMLISGICPECWARTFG